jgi:diadenosine tetraphosphatase ApaH/serine/threonine PP2A family protein phosphatase
MRLGIISDVHGNLAALEQVLRTIDAEHCNELVFLGDAVGYGPQPDECVAAIARLASISILGNHDDAVLGRTDPFSFNEFALKAVLWTRRVISKETQIELKQYMLFGRSRDNYYVHASAVNPRAWEYLFHIRDAERNFAACPERNCFIGHSHIPGGFVRDPEGRIVSFPPRRIVLDDQNRYIINVGSVGQPRDGDPRACFVIYDQDEGVVEFQRVTYEVQRTQELMRERRLPGFLIQRLQFGH